MGSCVSRRGILRFVHSVGLACSYKRYVGISGGVGGLKYAGTHKASSRLRSSSTSTSMVSGYVTARVSVQGIDGSSLIVSRILSSAIFREVQQKSNICARRATYFVVDLYLLSRNRVFVDRVGVLE